MGSEFEPAFFVADADAKAFPKLSGGSTPVLCEESLYESKSSMRDVVTVVFFMLFAGLVCLVATLVVAAAASSGGGDAGGDSTGTDPFLHLRGERSDPAESGGPQLKVYAVVQGGRPTATSRRWTSAPTDRELLCTVGHSAVTASMYPPDRYCDYLYYCDVIIIGGRLMGADDQTSWELFKKQAKTYRHVKVGVAFDFRYVTANKLHTARYTLNLIAQVNNIQHYGVLNIAGKKWHLRQAVNNMKPVFEKLKQFQGNDPRRKTVIAIASHNYTYFDIEIYKKIVTMVVNDFKVDTVIAVSSTGLMKDELTCSAAPPSALEAPNDRFPSLRLHSKLISASYEYRNPLVKVGLSFELGALIYLLKNDAPKVENIAYAPCIISAMTSRDAVCGQNPNAFRESKQLLGSSLHVVAGYLNATSKRDVVLSEFKHTPVDKFAEAERSYGPFREKLSWLLFNVHLGDHLNRCGTGPFDILDDFCHLFKGPC